MLQIVLSPCSNPFSVLRFISALVVCAVAAMSGPATLSRNIDSTASAQQTPGRRPIAFPTTIQWSKQRGVTKYRLQIAEDDRFGNVFYDGPVIGDRYIVTGLAPGYYYWRVAPAGSQTGAFLRPVRFFVSGGVVVSRMVSASPGMRTRVSAMPTPRIR